MYSFMKRHRMRIVTCILGVCILLGMYAFYAAQSNNEHISEVVYMLPESRQGINTLTLIDNVGTSPANSPNQQGYEVSDDKVLPTSDELASEESTRRAERIKELEAEKAELQAQLKEIAENERALNDLEEWVDSTFIPGLTALKPWLEEFNNIDSPQDMFDFYSEEERVFYISELSKFEDLCDRFADKIVALSDEDREMFVDVFSQHWGENAHVVIDRVNSRLRGDL